MTVTAIMLEVHCLHLMPHQNMAQLAICPRFDQFNIELGAETVKVDSLFINVVGFPEAGEILCEIL